MHSLFSLLDLHSERSRFEVRKKKWCDAAPAAPLADPHTERRVGCYLRPPILLPRSDTAVRMVGSLSRILLEAVGEEDPPAPQQQAAQEQQQEAPEQQQQQQQQQQQRQRRRESVDEHEHEHEHEHDDDDDASSVASSCGFETIDLPSDDEHSASPTGSSPGEQLRLDWDASAPPQPLSQQESPSQEQQEEEPPQPPFRKPAATTPHDGQERGAADDATPSPPGATSQQNPTPVVEDSPDGSQSQSPSQALFSFGGGLASPQEIRYDDDSQSQPAAQEQPRSAGGSASQSQLDGSPSLWHTRQPGLSAPHDDSDEEHEESLSLSPPLNTESQGTSASARESQNLLPQRQSAVPDDPEPGDPEPGDPEPGDLVDTRTDDVSPKRTVDSVPAGFRRVRGVVAAPTLPTSPTTLESSPRYSPKDDQSDQRTRTERASEPVAPASELAESSGQDDELIPGQMPSRCRPRARAESRAQRMCKYQYTRSSFRNRPAATNTGSRLARIIEKGSN